MYVCMDVCMYVCVNPNTVLLPDDYKKDTKICIIDMIPKV